MVAAGRRRAGQAWEGGQTIARSGASGSTEGAGIAGVASMTQRANSRAPDWQYHVQGMTLDAFVRNGRRGRNAALQACVLFAIDRNPAAQASRE
jgi:hypothetical protein